MKLENIKIAIIIIVIAWSMVLISLWFLNMGRFEGYYLSYDCIYASYSWQPDEKAISYDEEFWKYIVENNLHIKKEGSVNYPQRQSLL